MMIPSFLGYRDLGCVSLVVASCSKHGSFLQNDKTIKHALHRHQHSLSLLTEWERLETQNTSISLTFIHSLRNHSRPKRPCCIQSLSMVLMTGLHTTDITFHMLHDPSFESFRVRNEGKPSTSAKDMLEGYREGVVAIWIRLLPLWRCE
mmetsp:Transcript_650/g.1521  ORF Transcript_650/g.1521 Transcript_650/m.1521 type:complete len:149 (-) Transcript_650:170-616(-)